MNKKVKYEDVDSEWWPIIFWVLVEGSITTKEFWDYVEYNNVYYTSTYCTEWFEDMEIENPQQNIGRIKLSAWAMKELQRKQENDRGKEQSKT